MTSHIFLRWRQRRLNTTSGFLLDDATVFEKQISSKYINSRLRYNYFRFAKKQTSAIFEFYFRFRFPLYHRNWHAILHQTAEFHPKETTHCRNMTSYRFFKMAALPLNTTSGFPLVDATVFEKSKSIGKPNFVDISHLTAEI